MTINTAHLRQGQRLPVGPGYATVLADMDFETYSEAGYIWDEAAQKWRGITKNSRGLSAVGTPVYAEHPSTELLSLAYDLKLGDGPRLWLPGMAPPQDLFDYIASGGLIEAHNSGFEFLIWYYVCHVKMGWPALPLEQLRCSASKCRRHTLPRKLEKAALALGTDEQKDTAGGNIMRKLSRPRNPTKTKPDKRWTPENTPADFLHLYSYNVQDIKAEQAVSLSVPDLTDEELALWLLDQRINMRGVNIDRVALSNCKTVVEQAFAKYEAELDVLTGGTAETRGEVQKASELAKMIVWLGGRGIHTPSLDEDHVIDLLKRDDLPPECRRVLEIRQLIGAASIKKLFALDRSTSSDGRARELFVYCGASNTGRFAGRGAQPQNMPNSGPLDEWGPDQVEEALQVIASRDLATVEAAYDGDAVGVIAGCLRGLFTAAPGHDLICSDYSAIEGVIAAMLAGEQWRIDVFRSHGKIYEMGASKITGIPFEEMMAYAGYTDVSRDSWWLEPQTGSHHPDRKKLGKISELGSTFGGWINAWKNFGADKYLSDEEIKQAILGWRAASPAIVEMWGGQHRKDPHRWHFEPELFGIEGCVVSAIANPGSCYAYRDISYGVCDDILYCQLLSGRTLRYHQPRLTPTTARHGGAEYQISYMGVDSYTKKWTRIPTYGSRLYENVVQATAADILTNAMKALDARGYPIVLHIHDEIVSEIPKDTGSVEQFETIMAEMPEWAADWPIKAAGGWRGLRYRKD